MASEAPAETGAQVAVEVPASASEGTLEFEFEFGALLGFKG